MRVALFVIVAVFALARSQEVEEVQTVVGGVSGSGTTTRYWDCCKPSCSWKENVKSKNPVASCSADGVKHINASVHSACDDGGTSYICNNQQPWVVNSKLAYGFIAASFTGGADSSKCCICLRLSFQGVLSGKQMIAQVVNTGGDLGANHFDVQIPGGGVGIFTRGCHEQWNAPWAGWGQQYGGVSSESECSQLPSQLQAGCKFRFEWYQNADNPAVTFEQVTCPKEIVAVTGCSM